MAENRCLALELAKEEKPDLILMDMMLPEMDGVKVIEELQKNKLTQNIPVIVVSAMDEKMNFMKTVLPESVRYMEKPFIPEDLLYQIKTQFEKI